MIHEVIEKQSTERKSQSYAFPLSFSLDTQLKHINPLLLDFITSITATIRERKHSTLGRETDTSKHLKKVRIYYVLCLLQFCTNPAQPTLMHDLLADAVEMCGGSRQLLRILNRLGCTSSPDTHDRFVTQHAETQRKLSIWDELLPTVFTVASVDNFDMLQSHAAVYCGDQQRSYHGTTVQLVQPSPSITIHHNSEAVACTPTTIVTSPNNTQQLDNFTVPVHEADNEASNHLHFTSPPAHHHTISKRVLQYSPDRSPHKVGKTGPKRKRTVAVKNLTSALKGATTNTTYMYNQSLTMADFEESNDEQKEHQTLDSKLFSYILLKYTNHHHQDLNHVISEMRQFFDNNEKESAQPSKVHYMELVNENPDSDQTMSLVAENLLDKFNITEQDGWVVLVGDGKTYQHLEKIKQQYGIALEKVLIFPGDWHTLKNYQPILMKVYYHAGLRELAKSCGFHSTTLKSLELCSNFKRTHCFLVQVWEALYREMLHTFVSHTSPAHLMENVRCILEAGIKESRSPYNLMVRLNVLLEDMDSLPNFMQFVHKMAKIDSVWRLWVGFVFTNCYCYLTLYLAIRGSNWKLRLSSLKRMAPLFAAFDRDTYERIIPKHLADLKQYPASVLECLEAGGFTVSITGRRWHSVAFDEAHEMCINKDLKTAITRPSQGYLQKTSLFFNYRIKAFKNLIQELFPEKFEELINPNTITDSTPHVQHCEENVQKMCALIMTNKLVSIQEENRGLLNVFTGYVATPEQTTDMLSFRQIGLEVFQQYINTRILQTPSCASAPLRRRKLLTMSTLRKTRKRMTPKEQEAKQVMKCLRRRLQWCNQYKLSFDSSEEQYSILPRALADENGYPHKANKSHWTDKLQQRYQLAEPRVFTNQLLWIPQAVIIDAMFMINTKPLRRTATIGDYGKLLFHQYTVDHYKAGTNEVHFIFDNPGTQKFNPKQYERARRYNKATTKQHEHQQFDPDSNIPQGWQECLECTTCKRAIVEAIGLFLLQRAHLLLVNQQRLIIAGCFSGANANCAWLIRSDELPERIPSYNSNAQEADNRIWRHATQSEATKILIYSPDTDVYNIGLSMLDETDKDYIIQLSVHYSAEKRYLHLNHLRSAFLTDPDFNPLPRDHICLIMQSLFICTGCDFVSYFKSFGKATIANIFLQHASFISGSNSIGNLQQTNVINREIGFLSFVRLVGTCYFKKHITAFIANYSHSTPSHLYNSIDTSLSTVQKHQAWLQKIRQVVANRIINEEDRVPSHTSLWRHWLRSCWVHQMWQQSIHPDMYSSLPLPEHSGWIKDDEDYAIDWEDIEVTDKVKNTIQFLTKGCSCKTGCASNNCGCKKKSNYCGPGCECQGCTNLLTHTEEQSISASSNDDDNTTSENSQSDIGNCEEETEIEIVTDEFFDIYNIL